MRGGGKRVFIWWRFPFLPGWHEKIGVFETCLSRVCPTLRHSKPQLLKLNLYHGQFTTWRFFLSPLFFQPYCTPDSESILNKPFSSLLYQFKLNGAVVGTVTVSGRFAPKSIRQFAQTKSIRPMCICRSLSLRKRNKQGKTLRTACVKSKVD